jgi:hypothetical protein
MIHRESERGGRLPSERRAAVRHLCNLDTLFQPGEGRLDLVWWFARVRNISTEGIALLLGRRFEVGATLAIALQGQVQDVSRTIEARVVHASEVENGNWVVGCRFATPLTEAELKALLT